MVWILGGATVALAVAHVCSVSREMAAQAYLQDVLGAGDWLREELARSAYVSDIESASRAIRCWEGLTEGRAR